MTTAAPVPCSGQIARSHRPARQRQTELPSRRVRARQARGHFNSSNISAEGGRVVEGRSRGGGKRSGKRLEPMIMGEVRGGGATRHRGGRRRDLAHQDVVMHLAMDWLTATGELPKPGRSDDTGFGDLVHSVFQLARLS